jgi:CRP-like cAMP-binding protein
MRNAGKLRLALGGAEPVCCPFSQSLMTVGFRRGENLYYQGDAVRGAFNLTAGLVALERVDEGGDAVILKILRPGALFSFNDLFGDGIHSATARAVTEVSACFIPSDRLSAALAVPELRREILKANAESSRDDEDNIFRLCSSDLSERVLAVLASLAECNGHAVDGPVTLRLPVSWQEVSAMVGSSPEVISRTLRKLRQSGRIEMRGRQVTLHPEISGGYRSIG